MNPPDIPDHTLLRPIGKGAYGEVWLARNVMGALRAVKVIWREKFESDRPFLREFDGIQRFEPVSRSADGLVHVLHVGRNDAAGYFYYVMELADAAELRVESPSELSVESQPPPSVPDSQLSTQAALNSYSPRTLRSDLKRHGRLPTADCIRIALEVAGGLMRLHAQGLVHRDVKPGNIIFVAGRAKLADIGLVSTSEERRTFVGTEGYVPPEGPGSPVADIYALGLTIYEASTGLPIERFPDVPPEWFTAPGGDEALELHQILLKASEGQRERRYQSAKELQADLLLLHGGQSVRHVRALERRMRWVRHMALAAAAVGLIVALAVLVAGWRTRVAEKTRPKETNVTNRAESAQATAQKLHAAFSGAEFGGNTIVLNQDTTVNVPAGASLNIIDSISGLGTLTKVGAGTLVFDSQLPNSYTGTTWVKEGTLALKNRNNPYSNRAILGPLVIGDGIGGPDADVVREDHVRHIGNRVPITINSSGLLYLNRADDGVGALSGNGHVKLKGGRLDVNNPDATSTFDGIISGTGDFGKLGSGTLTLSGNNTLTGTTFVHGMPSSAGGTLLVNGSQPQSPVVVSNGCTLGGNGTVGHISVASGGTVSPGTSAGTLTCSNVTFQSGAHFNVKLSEATPGAGHSQLKARGIVTLDNAILDVTPGPASAENRNFTIIDNDGADAVVGTFDGLPENTAFNIGDIQFRISYTGGTGNDVVLTRLPPRPP